MNPESRTEVRLATQQQRRPPGDPIQISVRFAGDGEVADQYGSEPIELAIEATNDDGQLAPWFDDYWWTERIERWGNRAVILHLAPTPGAIVHPIVLHQMEMVCRVAPRWRMVGYLYRDDLTTEESVELLACSPYHEIRVKDAVRPAASATTTRRDADVPVEELFGRIRREQARLDSSRPVLVRLPSSSATPGDGVGHQPRERAATGAPI